MVARTPEGDALYERVLSELDAGTVAEALDALPAPRDGSAEQAALVEAAGTGTAGLVPAAPVVTGEVVDVRVDAVPVRGGGRRRPWAAVTAAVLAVACIGVALWCFPTARTEPVAAQPPDPATDVVVQTEADRLTLAAQRALDRVLGSGHSVVTVTAEYADPTERWSEQFGPTAVPTAQATATATSTDGAGGGYRYDGRVTNNGVDRTVEHVAGGGRVTRLSVAVVVDAALAPPPSVAVVRRWVGPAVGLQPRRGDQVSVVALPDGVGPGGGRAGEPGGEAGGAGLRADGRVRPAGPALRRCGRARGAAGEAGRAAVSFTAERGSARVVSTCGRPGAFCSCPRSSVDRATVS